jgi:hypothetical protein
MLAHLPIAVHGSIPGTDQNGTRALVEATEVLGKVIGAGADAAGDNVPRIVLYIGGDMLPTYATYCTAVPTLRTASARAGSDKIMMAAALCDGSRLVVTSRQSFTRTAVSEAKLAGTLRTIRARLLYALSMGRSQIPTEGNGYS